MSNPEASYLSTCLKSDNDVMLKAWQDGTKTITTDLVQETATSFYIRLCRNDKGSAWCVDVLAEYAPSLRLNSGGDTPMIAVARHCNEEFIIEHMASIKNLAKNPNSCFLTNEEGETALMIAGEEGKTPVVQLLLEHGADISHLSVSGETVIDKAKRSTNVNEVIDVLVDWITTHNVSSDTIEEELRDLFYEALAGGQDHLIEKLRPFADDFQKEMSRAIVEGRVDVVQRLVELGVDLNAKNETGLGWKDWARKQKQGVLIGVLSMAEIKTSQT